MFKLKCEVHAATETNVNYEVEWLINGEVNQTDTFTSADVKDGEIESILPGESLESFERIDQVSGILM